VPHVGFRVCVSVCVCVGFSVGLRVDSATRRSGIVFPNLQQWLGAFAPRARSKLKRLLCLGRCAIMRARVWRRTMSAPFSSGRKLLIRFVCLCECVCDVWLCQCMCMFVLVSPLSLSLSLSLSRSCAHACALGEAQDNQDAQFILGWKDGADPQADGAD
jgi:hypothetical protein